MARKFKVAFRYSLRTFLLILFLSVLFLIWIGNSYHQQKLEMALLEKLPDVNATEFKVVRDGELEILNVM